jgi:predicted CxxxxCH...CXXCH cytochrome family protein
MTGANQHAAKPLVLALLLATSCLERRAHDEQPATNECTACHGDGSRAADSLTQAAPPVDLDGNTAPDAAGVGAHLNHLLASDTHAAVPCATCHSVPASVDSPDHLTNVGQARVTLGGLATQEGLSPTYDFAAGTCQQTYCHGSSTPEWRAPRDSADACGSCHGLPPALPHPQLAECSRCHGRVIDSSQRIISPELHVDGQVEFEFSCTSCHGSSESIAPPVDTSGHGDVASPGVGAHQAHLAGTGRSRTLACRECHVVPAEVDSAGHIDATPGAEVIFSSAVAAAQGAMPSWSPGALTCSDTWCHGPRAPVSVSPVWNLASGPLGCTDCHGLPPAPPHPQQSDCSACHGTVVDSNLDFVAPERHVDGIVDATAGCTSCHGANDSPAPPPDTTGNTDVASVGVGAHQVHLVGRGRSRPVACYECHVVPATAGDPGHIDGSPGAEVFFAGVATTGGGTPSFSSTSLTCSETWCHGDSTSPIWTFGTGPLACTGCHGTPPPAPHVQATDCARCHGQVIDGAGTIIAPDRHVNGIVDLASGCTACHGGMGSNAPPVDVGGSSAVTSPGVGAHQVHLSGGAQSRPVLCSECHVVPGQVSDPGHLDSTPGAELVFSGVARTSFLSDPQWSVATLTCTGTWCHGPQDPTSSASPVWTSTAGRLGCTGCHGMPPPDPHPQLTDCSLCHPNVTGTQTLIDRTLHVNGRVE